MTTATIADQAYVVPLPGATLDARDLPGRTNADIADDVRDCLARLRDLGHEVLALDLTRPDVGFPTVRAVVPGLRHFWSRLAPGRLYDVPVRLEWLPAPLPESALNPIPFFL
jgi:oxazoline/thiazoline synthase